ncbi:hypothetical protein [Caldisericum sp. AR60]|uniref:hypothetical protein n=1 Tax=Caldisericum sp. AR60 TaxID=3397852 RepID=UPI0039FC3E98
MSEEQIFVSNVFGTVTDRRVVYFRKKGWFSGGAREDVPLRHVTSVRIDTTRNIIGGVIFVLIGLATIRFVVGVIPLAIGVLLFWGSPTVVINTAGGDLNVEKGWPWEKKSAEEFVEALHKQLFKE